MERIKRTKGERVLYVIVFIILAIYSLFILYHFYFLLQLATKGNMREYYNALEDNTLATWSKNFTLSHFGKAFTSLTDDNGNTFLDMTWNSVWFSTFSMLIILFFESAVTYVVCKYKFPGRSFLYNLVVFRLIFPIVGSLPSAYRVYKALGLMNSPLILFTATDALGGTSFLIMYAFYKSLSWEYAEAAFIDGANHFDVYFRIMVPMILPSASVLFVTGFIGRWNDYMTVSVFMDEMPTLSYGLYVFYERCKSGADYIVYYAGVLLASIPCLAIFVFFQNTIMQTVYIGGLKG